MNPPAPRFDPPPRTLERAVFLERFGGVYEHFPAIAEAVFTQGIGTETDTPEGLATAMATIAAGLPTTDKLQLIRNHPDLAGKTAIASLTAESRSEQSGAGLDQCSDEEHARFQALNAAYKSKFGFPFILAVGGRNRQEILEIFEQRMTNDHDAEFTTALEQIDRIALLRLRQIALHFEAVKGLIALGGSDPTAKAAPRRRTKIRR